MIKKLIEVNGWRIEKGSCMVHFWIEHDLGGMASLVEVTENKLYHLLDTADEIQTKEMDREISKDGAVVCKMKHGGIILRVIKKGA